MLQHANEVTIGKEHLIVGQPVFDFSCTLHDMTAHIRTAGVQSLACAVPGTTAKSATSSQQLVVGQLSPPKTPVSGFEGVRRTVTPLCGPRSTGLQDDYSLEL
jgi:hypothetical protein